MTSRLYWFLFVLIVLTVFYPSLDVKAGTHMNFQLSNHPSADSARKALDIQLPKGTSRDKVMHFLKAANIKCFDDEAEILACRVMEDSSTMVHVVWSLAFYFDPLRRLDRIVLSRGYVGP